jgi:hypothetical protein
MMPFRISPLVEAVDPVKLYEYMALGKRIIASYYPEIDRFGPYVSFYRTPSEFHEAVKAVISHPDQADGVSATVRAFLRVNTWDERVATIDRLLQNTSECDRS